MKSRNAIICLLVSKSLGLGLHIRQHMWRTVCHSDKNAFKNGFQNLQEPHHSLMTLCITPLPNNPPNISSEKIKKKKGTLRFRKDRTAEKQGKFVMIFQEHKPNEKSVEEGSFQNLQNIDPAYDRET